MSYYAAQETEAGHSVYWYVRDEDGTRVAGPWIGREGAQAYADLLNKRSEGITA